MKAWFAMHPPLALALFIVDLESFTFLNASYCPVLKQLQASSLKRFYFSQEDGERDRLTQTCHKSQSFRLSLLGIAVVSTGVNFSHKDSQFLAGCASSILGQVLDSWGVLSVSLPLVPDLSLLQPMGPCDGCSWQLMSKPQ